MITEQEAINLLEKHSSSPKSFQYVLAHVQAVQRVAVRIAAECKGVDMEVIAIGSLLHDIGRFAELKGKERVRHGIIGGQILREEGVDEAIARIAERHIGVGIRKKDIIEQDLPLPHQDFVPETREEKIIAHADNLIFGHEEKPFEAVVERFRRELGEQYVLRAKKLQKEIEEMRCGN